MGEMIYHGKVKQVWSTDNPDIIEFRYTDQISVFDQIIPSLIPRKGESLNRTSCHWFKLVEEAGICDTHVIEMNAPDRVLARRFDVIREPGAISRDQENVFVPLEVICRHYLAGSGWRRYARGDAPAEEFGFEPGTILEEGVKLPKPYLEVSTKFEKFDRLLDRAEALEISNLTDEEFDSILEIVVKVDEIIESEAAKRGLIHVDGKKEFALGEGRVPVLVDSFGTLDEDRWWDAEAYDKERLCNYRKNLSEVITLRPVITLNFMRRERQEPKSHQFLLYLKSIIDQTSTLYADMFERLTGQKF